MNTYERSQFSGSPRPPRGTLGAASTGPVFLDAGGNPITSIVCGASYTFDVPGYDGQTIWLTEYKNGAKVFDGLFPIPMPSYTSVCATDPGTYQAVAYDAVSGMVLGQTTFQVLPAGSTAPGGGTLPGTGIFANLTTMDWLGIGAAAFLFLRRKKR